MTVTSCAGGYAKLEVDYDGYPTSYAGLIGADGFAIVAPKKEGFGLEDGAPKPRVSNGGRTFTVHAAKLREILNDDTVIATGSVTCP